MRLPISLICIALAMATACTDKQNLAGKAETNSSVEADQIAGDNTDESASEPVMVAGSYLYGRCGSYQSESKLYGCGIHIDEEKDLAATITSVRLHSSSNTFDIVPTTLEEDEPWHIVFELPAELAAESVSLVDISFSKGGEDYQVVSDSVLMGRPLITAELFEASTPRLTYPLGADFNRAWLLKFDDPAASTDQNLDGFEDWLIDTGGKSLDSVVVKNKLLKSQNGEVKVSSGQGFENPIQLSLDAAWSLLGKRRGDQDEASLQVSIPIDDVTAITLVASLSNSIQGVQHLDILVANTQGVFERLDRVEIPDRFVRLSLKIDVEDMLINATVNGSDRGGLQIPSATIRPANTGVFYGVGEASSLLSYIHFQAGYER